jgi:hypothetical protein
MNQSPFDMLKQWMDPLKAMEKSAGVSETTVADPAAAQGTAGKKLTTQATQTSVEKQNLSVNNVPAIKNGENLKPMEGAEGGPNVLMAGEKPEGMKIKKEQEGMNKAARVSRLGKNLLDILAKEATVMAVDMQKTAADQAIEKEAAEAATVFAQYYAMGKAQRMQDFNELQSANIPSDLLGRVGGIDGLLDKAASEDPASVLPPELAGAMGGEGAAPEAAAPEMAQGAGAGEDPQAMMDEMAQILDANGVTVDELQQVMQQIEALKAQGFSEEEIMQSLMEAAQSIEQTAAPAEAPEAPEVEEQKEASSRARIDALRDYFVQSATR